MKTFYVDDGHEVRHRNIWHESGSLLVVGPGETIQIYAALNGRRGVRLATYPYPTLNPSVPPQGLRRVAVIQETNSRGVSP